MKTVGDTVRNLKREKPLTKIEPQTRRILG